MDGWDDEGESGLRLHLLGGFELRHAGRTVPLPRGAQRLAAFLALQPRPQQRIAVAGRLWPEMGDARAQACLRSALWRLRADGAGLARASRDELALASGVAVDLRALEAVIDDALAADGDHLPSPALLRLLSRELLPDWYDEWVLPERERLKELCLHALEALAERMLARERPRDAARCALAAVMGEPLRESAERLLIRAHLAEGNTALAARRYDAFRETLADQVGEEPSWRMDDIRAGNPGDG